jgi:hypothetical protein
MLAAWVGELRAWSLRMGIRILLCMLYLQKSSYISRSSGRAGWSMLKAITHAQLRMHEDGHWMTEDIAVLGSIYRAVEV